MKGHDNADVTPNRLIIDQGTFESSELFSKTEELSTQTTLVFKINREKLLAAYQSLLTAADRSAKDNSKKENVLTPSDVRLYFAVGFNGKEADGTQYPELDVKTQSNPQKPNWPIAAGAFIDPLTFSKWVSSIDAEKQGDGSIKLTHHVLIPNSFKTSFPTKIGSAGAYQYEPNVLLIKSDAANFPASPSKDSIVSSLPFDANYDNYALLGIPTAIEITVFKSDTFAPNSGGFLAIGVPYLDDSDEHLETSVTKGLQSITAKTLAEIFGGAAPAPDDGDSGDGGSAGDANAVAQHSFESFSTQRRIQVSKALDLSKFGMTRADSLPGTAVKKSSPSDTAPSQFFYSYEFKSIQLADNAKDGHLSECVTFTPEYKFGGDPNKAKDDDSVQSVVLTAQYHPETCNACGEGDKSYQIKWTPKVATAAGKYVQLGLPIQCDVDYVVGFASDADDSARRTFVQSVLPSGSQDSAWPALAQSTFALAAEDSPFTGTHVIVPVFDGHDQLSKAVRALSEFFSEKKAANPPAPAAPAGGGSP